MFSVNDDLDVGHYSHLVITNTAYETSVNTLRPRQNGRHFADDMFKCVFLNENVWIPIEISLTFVPKGWINNNPALFQIMAWRRPGDKPLSEPMMVSSLTHICVTRPQWVKLVDELLKSFKPLWSWHNYHSRKFISTFRLQNHGHFLQPRGINVCWCTVLSLTCKIYFTSRHWKLTSTEIIFVYFCLKVRQAKTRCPLVR